MKVNVRDLDLDDTEDFVPSRPERFQAKPRFDDDYRRRQEQARRPQRVEKRSRQAEVA